MACTISLDNATTLGWDVSFEYTDNQAAKLKQITSVNVSLLATDLDNLEGVGECVAPLTDLREDRSYPEIILKSHSFGSGQLKSFNLAEGDFTNVGVATLSFEVIEDIEGEGGVCWLKGEGNESGYYDGLPLDDPLFEPKNLDNLSESFSFSSGQNGGGSFSHSIDVKFNSTDQVVSDISISDAQANINRAQALAKDIFNSNDQPPFGISVLPGILTGSNLSVYYSEQLDYVNSSCSFEKTYDAPSQNCRDGACPTYNLSYNRSDCSESVSIDGDIAGTKNTPDSVPPKTKIDYAAAVWSGDGGEKSKIDGRLSGMFERFREGGGANLNTGEDGGLALTTLCTTIDSFEGKISYNAEATNDPAKEGDAEVTQTQTVNYSKADGPPVKEIITVAESVSINGKGKKRTVNNKGTTEYPAYEKATEKYTDLWDGAESRIKALYPEGSWAKDGDELLDSSDLNKSATSQKSNPSAGTKGYTITYSDDPRFSDSDTCITEQTVNITDHAAKQRFATSTLPQYGSIVEPMGYEKPKRNISIVLKGTGDCSEPTGSFTPSFPKGVAFLLESGKAVLDAHAATCYIKSLNYNYTENAQGKNLSMSAEMIDEYCVTGESVEEESA